MDLVPKICKEQRIQPAAQRGGRASMWTSARAEAFPSCCLVGMDSGLEMAKGQPGKMGTQDCKEGADRGRRAAVCTHMRVGCACVCVWGRSCVEVGGAKLDVCARVSERTAV